MENFKLDNQKIGTEISEFITKKINAALSPLNLLTYAVGQYGCPVLTFDNVYDPKGEDIKDVCYGVYVNKHEKGLDLSRPFDVGTLMMMGKTDKGELFTTDADDFLGIFAANREEYDKMCKEFASHFLEPLGWDFEGLMESVFTDVILGIAKTIPYEDMIHAYPMEEVGEYHNNYDGQCYVDDCRDAADRAEETEDEREIREMCRKG